jgi:hypothetical protein
MYHSSACKIRNRKVEIFIKSNISDKGLNDWTLDEELMDPLAILVAFENYSGIYL